MRDLGFWSTLSTVAKLSRYPVSCELDSMREGGSKLQLEGGRGDLGLWSWNRLSSVCRRAEVTSGPEKDHFAPSNERLWRTLDFHCLKLSLDNTMFVGRFVGW